MSAANLRTWLAWCQASATDPALDDDERALWASMAAQITTYLEEHP